ncbi:MAG: Sodium-transporting ATPase subunit [Spirosoma sp.]|nr:Sodium-transporting ATPase subunit [Spirosoma sp.]
METTPSQRPNFLFRPFTTMEPADKKNKTRLSNQVGQKAIRKLNAQSDGKNGVWYGLGMFGMIGWSVVVPALAGTALGVWLDEHEPQSFSWTLTLLVLGLFGGCLIAWFWVTNEDKKMHQTKMKNDE